MGDLIIFLLLILDFIPFAFFGIRYFFTGKCKMGWVITGAIMCIIELVGLVMSFNLYLLVNFCIICICFALSVKSES